MHLHCIVALFCYNNNKVSENGNIVCSLTYFLYVQKKGADQADQHPLSSLHR